MTSPNFLDQIINDAPASFQPQPQQENHHHDVFYQSIAFLAVSLASSWLIRAYLGKLAIVAIAAGMPVTFITLRIFSQVKRASPVDLLCAFAVSLVMILVL